MMMRCACGGSLSIVKQGIVHHAFFNMGHNKVNVTDVDDPCIFIVEKCSDRGLGTFKLKMLFCCSSVKVDVVFL